MALDDTARTVQCTTSKSNIYLRLRSGAVVLSCTVLCNLEQYESARDRASMSLASYTMWLEIARPAPSRRKIAHTGSLDSKIERYDH